MQTFARVGTILLLLSIGTGAPAAYTATLHPDPSAGDATRCRPWQNVPVRGNSEELITGIDGLSGSDLWAVVDAFYAPHPPKILHWNGIRWIESSVQGVSAVFDGVSVISATDAWAVGSEVVHWNGSAWAKVPVPAPQGDYDFLYGVSGTSSSDVWAVGDNGYGRGLIVHWDGATWSIVPHPDYQQGEFFFGVVALAPNDAWLVGEQFIPDSTAPIIQHWDGNAWSNVKFPHPNRPGVMAGVGASGPNDVWAVGRNYSGDLTLLAHWDGTSWRRLTAFPFQGGAALTSVSALTPGDVWVAGYIENTSGPPIAAHWSGASWKGTRAARGNQWLLTIKAFDHTHIWGAGGGAYGMLAERFVGCS